VHFPGHRFVLVGFDDEREVAYIADRIRAEPEVCSYPALFLSRNPPEGLSTQNQWGRFHTTLPTRSLAEAAHFAIERCSRRMLNRDPAAADEPSPIPALDLTNGIAGIRRLAAELPHWGQREDARWLASYNARCIEKFGNGGGNFRRLYADFLEWAQGLGAGLVPENAPSLARRAADAWTRLSGVLELASGEEASAEVWSRAADETSRIAELESELFASLAAAAG
jgi:hypothetical protein